MSRERHFNCAFVTGASSGIGESFARFLASKGSKLLIHGRNKERLEALRSELATQVDVDVITGELSDPQDRERLVEKIREADPDLIVNNAGYGFYGPVLAAGSEEQIKILQTNCEALVHLSIEGARNMVSKGQSGVILNVSSAGAFQPFPYFATYVASKAFVNSFSESIDEELRPYGIRVLASCPGVVGTRFSSRAGGQSGGPASLRMSVDYAAEQLWQQIQREKPVHIFNWLYRFFITLGKMAPRSLSFRLQKKQILSRKPEMRVRLNNGDYKSLTQDT